MREVRQGQADGSAWADFAARQNDRHDPGLANEPVVGNAPEDSGEEPGTEAGSLAQSAWLGERGAIWSGSTGRGR